EDGPGQVAEHVPVAVGQPVEPIDHQNRQRVGVFGDQVGAAVGHEGVDEVVGDPAHGAFGGGHVDPGEAVDDGCAQSGVYGAVGVPRGGAPGEGVPGRVHERLGDGAPASG